MEKINIITLGCSKNLVDSEVIATYLQNQNKVVVFDDFENTDYQTVIVNTCGFIHDAKVESIDTIMYFAKLKQEKIIKQLFVTGCLSERYRKELQADIPEADAIFGVNLLEILKNFNVDYRKNLYGERLISTPSHYAYLKIAEGCNKKCAFCAIPAIRGKHISKTIDEIYNEAQFLVNQGVKEILLISQDTSYYGKDNYNSLKINELLYKISEINNLSWLRLHYLYPTTETIETINTIAKLTNVCNYIDIPFQHASDKILKSMRRGHTQKLNRQIIEHFKNILPQGALRTTFIVGYPGETDKDFRQLVDFIQEAKFDRLGVFTYSEEEGTFAANLKDDVPENIKNERKEIIMDIQTQISLEKNLQKIGKTYKVLIDDYDGTYFIGRTELDSPEVDNEVLIKSENLEIGEFYNVKITDAAEFDLFGKVEN
jgi:ribosomal protein S12 methylthiotransferase